MPRYMVRFHPRLSIQLEQHAEFIARVSKSTAVNFRSEFLDVIRRLSDNPHQFPPYDDPVLPPDAYRKAGFAKWYKLVFSIEDGTVFVDAVVDGRAHNGFF